MKRLIYIIILLSLLLSGCAASRLTPQDEAKVSKVGIVVLVPQQVPFNKLGWTVFGNEQATFDTGGRVERSIRSAAESRLAASRASWAVKPLHVDRDGLMRAAARRAGGSIDMDVIRGDLAKIATAESLDALFVFVESYYDRLGGAGVSVRERPVVGGGELALLQGNIAAFVLDAKGSVLASATNGFEMDFWRINAAEYGLSIPLGPGSAEKLSHALSNLLTANTLKRMDELGY